MNRFLAIDYGIKRIGIALSDEGGILAFPKEIFLNNFEILEKLEIIIKKENVSEIVIGESTNFLGEPNILAKKIEEFVFSLKKKFNLPVHFQKEFLTSVEARRYSQNKHVDASAAALILQRYLDKRNSKKNLDIV